MKKSVVAATIAAVAVFAGVIYYAREPAPKTPAGDEPAKAKAAPVEAAKPPIPAGPGLLSSSKPPPRATPPDARLAALMSSPENAQIQYFTDPEGRVIREIDNDPASLGYGNPLREYTYAGKQIIRLVTYHYLGDQVQVTTADVVYKPDGSVDQYHEVTTYRDGEKAYEWKRSGRVN